MNSATPAGEAATRSPVIRLKARRAFLLISALPLSLGTVASAQDGVNRIRGLAAVLTVHADASFDVTEELTVELVGESNEIVRELSLRDDSARGDAKKLDVTVLAVTNENGQPLRVEEVSGDSGWVYSFGR